MNNLPVAGTQTNCSCDICKSMCSRPCWPTPNEAIGLIKLGHASKLMDDYWVGGINNEGCADIHILCGASRGYEGEMAPWPGAAPCAFQDNETKLCQIHNSGFKPIEARLTDCKGTQDNLHKEVAALWENDRAQKLVKLWWEHNEDNDTSWVDSLGE